MFIKIVQELGENVELDFRDKKTEKVQQTRCMITSLYTVWPSYKLY